MTTLVVTQNPENLLLHDHTVRLEKSKKKIKKKNGKFIFELHVFEVWEKYTEFKKSGELLLLM